MTPRETGLTAARAVMDASEQNVLGRALAWQTVSAALDAYDDAWQAQLVDRQTVAYAVTCGRETPVVMPTLRMAKRYRRQTAALMGKRRSEYRIVLVLSHLPV